jgi:hypothetical protein
MDAGSDPNPGKTEDAERPVLKGVGMAEEVAFTLVPLE